MVGDIQIQLTNLTGRTYRVLFFHAPPTAGQTAEAAAGKAWKRCSLPRDCTVSLSYPSQTLLGIRQWSRESSEEVETLLRVSPGQRWRWSTNGPALLEGRNEDGSISCENHVDAEVQVALYKDGSPAVTSDPIGPSSVGSVKLAPVLWILWTLEDTCAPEAQEVRLEGASAVNLELSGGHDGGTPDWQVTRE